MAEYPALALVIAEEKIRGLRNDIELLIRAHWREVARDRDKVPLDVDWKLYQLMEDTGGLRIWTARDSGVLLGYCAWFIRSGHPHYKSTPWAQNDVLYVAPGARRGQIGRALLEASLAGLRPGKGMCKVQLHAKVTHDFPELAKACGFDWSEKIYERLI